MRYADDEGPGGDATRTFLAFRTPATDGVRYADSGSVPDGGSIPGDGPGGGPGGGRFSLACWQQDADDDSYPVPDRYAGYEQYAGYEEYAREPAADAERSFTRAYARPADPRQAPWPGDAGQAPWPRAAGQAPWPEPVPPAAGYPGELAHDDRAPRFLPGGPAPEPWPAAGAPRAPLTGRLSRMRADRWVLAVGGLVAAAAVAAAFVTAGGSGAAGRSGTARTAPLGATRPACVSPAPGR